ncbi:hypothetical protein AVEN_109662-1 [Araneus ventricosus]|uniref:Uncharacterized protein n=1 Tax=Araneus ventricosus TaxID=182803 RepID=A0A4Y2G0C0_ARAVE|nr:hypothetical protein AVEN_109662-1 [Araneus ventricosus]
MGSLIVWHIYAGTNYGPFLRGPASSFLEMTRFSITRDGYGNEFSGGPRHRGWILALTCGCSSSATTPHSLEDNERSLGRNANDESGRSSQKNKIRERDGFKSGLRKIRGRFFFKESVELHIK